MVPFIIWEHEAASRRIMLGHDGAKYSVLECYAIREGSNIWIGPAHVDSQFSQLDNALARIEEFGLKPPTRAELALTMLAR
jgi:hypothetical protein